MIRTALRALALTVFFVPLAWAQEAAVTRRALELRDAPGEQGRTVAGLPARTAVTRTNERQGAWVQVRTATGASGWVHLFDIGPASAPAEGGSLASGALRSVTGLFGGGRPAQVGSTAGIRGLGAEDIAHAEPDGAAVARMETWRQTDADARAFADRASLRATAVEPLPQPGRASTGANGHPSQPESP